MLKSSFLRPISRSFTTGYENSISGCKQYTSFLADFKCTKVSNFGKLSTGKYHDRNGQFRTPQRKFDRNGQFRTPQRKFASTLIPLTNRTFDLHVSRKLCHSFVRFNSSMTDSLKIEVPMSSRKTGRLNSSLPSLPFGYQDFDKAIRKNNAIIDKTLFIKEFIQDGAEAIVILRPRRFGKSLNLSMLKSFLSLGQTPSNFTQYLIGKEEEFMKKHCGKYPVVALDLKDCKGENWEEMYRQVWTSIREMIEPHFDDLEADLNQMASYGVDFKNLTVPHHPENVIARSLKWLIKSLYKKHKIEVILLVDEYDSPLNHAFRKGYYNEASIFFGEFYSQALKGNSALEKACMMGIVEARGAGILSGLNNIKVYSVSSDKYSSFFGFTIKEISDFLGNDQKDIQQVIDWYNGYHMGNETVVNPWSFVNTVHDKKLQPYWISTSSAETIGTILAPHVKESFGDILAILFNNHEKFKVDLLDTQVNYTETHWETSSLLHFLVHTGYLTYEENEDGQTGKVWIPNKEVRQHWEKHVMEILKTRFKPLYLSQLCECILADDFDIKSLEKVMKDMLQHNSFYDLTHENSYHVFFFSALLISLHDGENIIVSSNKESGQGRYDICINLVEKKRVLIIECKKSKTSKDLPNDADKAMKQIIDRNYFADFPRSEHIPIGVAFFKKEMSSLVSKIDKLVF